MMRRTGRLLMLAGLVSLVGSALPSMASEPASSAVTVPSQPGQTVTSEWTGLIPPGANSASDCTQGASVSDTHTVEMTVPDGVYSALRAQATFFLDYDGPTTDAIVTVVLPDGTALSGDGGFVDTDESVGLSNPAPGTYTFYACVFAGAIPTDYQGRLEITTEAIGADTEVVATGPACTPQGASPKFESRFIDEARAGGEPIVTTHPDGTLLWGSHAGTTHVFGPAAPDPTTLAFLQNYEGQTYQYYYNEDGDTWEFVPRSPVGGGLDDAPGSGFSDPEFAIDAAGNVFISEINLANVAVSKSSDSGRSYTLQNFTGFTLTDRQWMSADEEDVVYMTGNAIAGGTFPGNPIGTSGHVLVKSTDGGVTWTDTEVANPGGVADHKVNRATGDLYEISEAGGTLSMAVFRGIRDADSGFGDLLELNTIVTGAGLSGIGRQIDPTFDMDSAGNLYFTWTENGTGAREKGVYYSYSTDDAQTWHDPVRIDAGEGTEIWPWLAVGDPGQVAIVYLSIDNDLENNNAELAEPEDGWNVIIAATDTGLGCGESTIPGFRLTQASAEPVHYGTICQGGTACQAELVDRRLGDYFANEVDGDGNAYIAVSNTTQGGSVSLPFEIRQVGGPAFTGGTVPAPQVDPPTPAPEPAPTSPLPTTGGGMAVLGALLLGAGGLVSRSRRGRGTLSG